MNPLVVATTTSAGETLVHYQGTAQEVLNAVEAFHGNLVVFGSVGSSFYALCRAV